MSFEEQTNSMILETFPQIKMKFKAQDLTVLLDQKYELGLDLEHPESEIQHL